MTPVRMIVEWFVPLGQARPITNALNSLMVDTRATRGCVGCFISTGIKDQGTVRYIEEWQTEEDLRRRLESSAFSGLTALIEGAAELPRIEFMLPGGMRGLDFLQEVRHASSHAD